MLVALNRKEPKAPPKIVLILAAEYPAVNAFRKGELRSGTHAGITAVTTVRNHRLAGTAYDLENIFTLPSGTSLMFGFALANSRDEVPPSGSAKPEHIAARFLAVAYADQFAG